MILPRTFTANGRTSGGLTIAISQSVHGWEFLSDEARGMLLDDLQTIVNCVVVMIDATGETSAPLRAAQRRAAERIESN